MSGKYQRWKLPELPLLWVLLDIHECWGDLWIAPSPMDKQPAGYKLPHDWLACIYIATLYNTLYVEVKMTPVDAIWLFLVMM